MPSSRTMMIAAAAVLLAACISVASALPETMTGPVIGILAQPLSEETPAPHDSVLYHSETSGEVTYIAASYVKFVESSGARAVPIMCHLSDEELASKLSKVNGVLFPGGGQNLTDQRNCYTNSATRIMKAAEDMYGQGDYFPVWGTCLGFQMVSVFVGGGSVLESGFDSEDLPLALNFTPGAITSRMFDAAPKNLLSAIATEAITMNNHHSGVTPAAFANSEKLSSFFNILSTNADRQGREFVSSIEGKDIPFYAVQWHPEKNSFEWTQSESIPHSANAIATTQLMGNFLISEARKSNHAYPPEELVRDIIYNFNTTFSGKKGSGFEQIYLFNEI